MRHLVAGRKLGRTTSHRKALMRNLAVALISHGRIKTTLNKARELRGFADKLVTLGKKDSLHARRLAFDRLRDRDAVIKLFHEIVPAFQGRNGGYTRIYKLGRVRSGDTAEMALIEYLSEDLLKKTAEGIKVKKANKERKAESVEIQADEKAPKKPSKPRSKVSASKSEKKPAKKAKAKSEA